MASRFFRWCSPGTMACLPLLAVTYGSAPALILLCSLFAPSINAQFLLKPAQPGEPVSLMPSDIAILESGDARKDLSCTVTPRNADLGFDLRFHTGYDATIPLNAIEGEEQLLTVVFRVHAADDKLHPAYFVQHFHVPVIPEDAKGDAT